VQWNGNISFHGGDGQQGGRWVTKSRAEGADEGKNESQKGKGCGDNDSKEKLVVPRTRGSDEIPFASRSHADGSLELG
jgi:hypothetical protein